VAISDTLIELLTFSKPELLDLADHIGGVGVPRTGDKFDVALAISQQIGLADLQALAGEHLGAGRTSLSWVALLPKAAGTTAGESAGTSEEPINRDTPLTTDAIAMEDVTTALRKITGKRDPLNANLRPRDVTAEPVLVNVHHDRDDMVLFTLAYAGSQRLSIRNFNYSRYPEDRFFHIVLRLSRGILEIRADGRIAGKVTKGWIADFADALGRQGLRLHLSHQDVEDMAQKLSAVVDKHEARNEDEDAGYGKQTVTASVKYPDVRTAPKFKDDFEGSDPVSSDLVFDWSPDNGASKPVRLRISPRAGTIRCVNHVSNAVMEHVYDTLRDVRAERRRSSKSSSNPAS
jgi:hypothetical protein